MTQFGIMVNLYGPIEGQRHDARILRMSGLLDQLAQNIPWHGTNPDDVIVPYGDSASPLRAYLQAPFGGSHITPAEKQFNSLMSKSRVCEECFFVTSRQSLASWTANGTNDSITKLLASTKLWLPFSLTATHVSMTMKHRHISTFNRLPLGSTCSEVMVIT